MAGIHDDFDALPEPNVHQDFDALPDAPQAPAPEVPKPLEGPARWGVNAAGSMVPMMTGGLVQASDLVDSARGVPKEAIAANEVKRGMSALQGLTLGRAGDVSDALARKTGLGTGMGKEFSEAAAEHPLEQVGGALALPIPGPGKLKALGAAAPFVRPAITTAVGAGLGALQGDTTLPVEKRAALGAAAGFLGGLGGEALTAIASKASAKVGQAIGDAANAARDMLKDAAASGKGAFGAAVQAASRDLEVIEREAEAGDAAAQAFLKSPSAAALKRMVLGNKLESAPGRLADVAEKKAAFQEAQRAAESPEAIQAATEEQLKAGGEGAKKFGVHLLNKALPAAAGAVAGPQAAAGMALASGHVGTRLKNFLSSPANRKLLWESVQKVATTGGNELGRFGPLLERELESNPQGALALHTALAEKDPEYQGKLEQLAQQP